MAYKNLPLLLLFYLFLWGLCPLSFTFTCLLVDIFFEVSSRLICWFILWVWRTDASLNLNSINRGSKIVGVRQTGLSQLYEMRIKKNHSRVTCGTSCLIIIIHTIRQETGPLVQRKQRHWAVVSVVSPCQYNSSIKPKSNYQ